MFPALQFQLQAASDGRHMATGVAMFAFFRGLGQTLGISIGGTIFQKYVQSVGPTKIEDFANGVPASCRVNCQSSPYSPIVLTSSLKMPLGSLNG